MRRDLAFGGPARPVTGRCTRSIACLAFVAVLAAAFWIGALIIGHILMRIAAHVFV